MLAAQIFAKDSIDTIAIDSSDPLNNLTYIAGKFNGSADFNPSPSASQWLNAESVNPSKYRFR